jgi:hypothetical protein
MAEALASVDPNHPALQQYRAHRTAGEAIPGTRAIEQVVALLGKDVVSSGQLPPRQLIEHATVVDSLRHSTIVQAAQVKVRRGDAAGSAELLEAEAFAKGPLGFRDLRSLDDFPIGLCAAGYTRISRDPNRSILKPFENRDAEDRTPLYVVTTETEGIYVQLDPVRVVKWLTDNNLLEVSRIESEPDAWAKLYRLVPGLFQSRWHPQYTAAAAVAVRTLIHTISHVLLRHVEWSGFGQSSVGEYLLPGSLATVLYANRYAESKIGGLTTLFEQRLGIWLADSEQSGRECVYDPFCSDEGGSCVGCLHREHNCPLYNQELSRAALYSGPMPQGTSIIEPIERFTAGYWQMIGR